MDSLEPQAPTTAETIEPEVFSPAPAPVPTRKRGNGYWRWYAAAAVVGIAVASGAYFANSEDSIPVAATPVTTTIIAPAASPAGPAETATIETPIARANPTHLLLDAAAVGRSAIPSVVTVQISGSTFGGQEGQIGSGSGVVYDNQGHVITNDHVVSAGTSYEIVLADGRIYPAEVVGTDPTTDLAVLKVTAEDLPPLAIGNSDVLTVGDPAVAVGSPLGLDGGPSLTVGVISAFGREVRTDATTFLFGMLQTDAPITSGSSGGALVDSAGQLVGITTAVGVSEVGVEGIGFATPVEIVTRVADEIIATGEASSPYLGILPIPALEDTLDGGSIPIGIEVETVEPDTAAAAAGVEVGDIIAAIDGIEIKTFNELVAALRRFGAGTTIDVTLQNGAVLEITLGQRPSGQ